MNDTQKAAAFIEDVRRLRTSDETLKLNDEEMYSVRDQRPQRFGWAPGGYICHCHSCGKRFVGDKRASMCAPCSYNDEGLAEGLKEAAADFQEHTELIAACTALLNDVNNRHPSKPRTKWECKFFQRISDCIKYT